MRYVMLGGFRGVLLWFPLSLWLVKEAMESPSIYASVNAECSVRRGRRRTPLPPTITTTTKWHETWKPISVKLFPDTLAKLPATHLPSTNTEEEEEAHCWLTAATTQIIPRMSGSRRGGLFSSIIQYNFTASFARIPPPTQNTQSSLNYKV